MKKLTVFSYRDDVRHIIRKMTYLRCVDIRQTDLGGTSNALSLSHYDCIEERNKAEASVENVKKALSALYPYSKRTKSLIKPRIEVDLNEFMSGGRYERAKETVSETLSAVASLEELKERENELRTLYTSLLPFKRYASDLGIQGTEHTSVLLGSVRASKDHEKDEEDFAKLVKAAEPFYASVDNISRREKTRYIRIICHKSDEKDVLKALSPFGFVRLSFPQEYGKAQDIIPQVKRSAREICERQRREKEKLSRLALMLDELEILYDAEQTSLGIINQEAKLGTTEYTAMLEAWVPAKSEKKMAEMLSSFEAAYEFRDPKPYEDPPVLLINNGFARNFEWVIGMYSYPKYGSFDPTFIMSIFYFVLFGIMFADVGYGLLLSVLCFTAVRLMKPQDGTKRFLMMFGYCGISSAVMGAVFGGWFGDLPFAVMTKLLGMEDTKKAVPFFNGMWFNPLDDPMRFLIVSLSIGGAHLVAGMAIKFYLICKEGKILDAIFDIGSWWVLFAGIGLIFVNTAVGYVTLGVGVLMLVLTQGRTQKNIPMKILKGIGSLYGIVSYLSDLLSYSRILALGMVGGVIGQVVNMITGLGSNFFGFIIMLIVLVIGHLLNLAINVLGTFVHTSRLQYIEFFNKFYEDGGKPFTPAKPSEKYTAEKQ